ncbi:Serine-aspartate repeat-containing protein D precursor [Stieleria maiorica]|uniref:Serine-aspartate repeat-containing protein D n=1 Tax=Stieleria maiorica TaxID=2795974 RepID=A0A5B9M5H5_9BACT|nr:beta-propeller fold lactonase family protein [Stieleria maiorica]QEF96371.1 Serine-aspartate repeat-containing protein D precursor [Stieleria maiorica]
MLYEALEARHLLTASIEGLVFGDTNQDGIQNLAETGIAGVTVYSDLNSNGTRDAGEPFTQTTADDPGTPGVDELGRYVIDNLSEQTHHVTIELSANTRQTAPFSPATGMALRLFEDAIRPVQTNGSGPSDIQVSADGQFVFVGWDQGRRITTFTRRVQDGQLAYQSELYDTELYGIRRSVASSDGNFLYVPAEYSDAINVLQIDSAGTLSVVQTITISADSNLDRVNALTLAPDGSQLLATSTTTKSLLIYDVDSASGTLTLSQTFKEGVDGVTGLNFPAQARVSPDGTLVAVATQASGNPLTLLDRDPVTGIVTPSGTSLALGSNRDVIFSDDGRFLYVADFNGRLWTLTRDEVNGDVQVQGSINLGTKRLDKLVMRPDQAGIYATSSYTDSLLTFHRDPASGAVTLDQTFDPSDVSGLSDAEGIAISPDGKHLYLASQRSNRIQTFWTNATGQTPVPSLVTTISGQTVTDINFAVSDASPRVTEISTTSVSPEPADSVTFAVVFDEAVTGVDTSDFQLIDSGLPQAAITSVSGSGTDYTVTVSTPNYSGNLQLQLVDDDTIVDVNSVPLGGNGTGAVAARTAPLLVDSLPPQVVALAASNDVAPMARALSFYVTFDESVSGVDVTDFQTMDAGGAVGTVDAVVATGDASVYRIDVSVSGTAGSVALRLIDDDTIVDVAANPLGDVGTAGGASGDGSFQSSAAVIDDARIVGRVRIDGNGDGLFDSDEFGQPGITVYADTNLNGTLDAGEPSAVTQSDDPGTSEVDESGTYELTSLATGTTYSLRIDSSQHRQTTPVLYAVDDGTLTFADSVFGGSSTSDSLYSVDGITVTNDGKQLYAISPFGNKVSLFTRESVSAPFAYETSWSDATPGFSGLASPTLLIFRPDEQFGYLLAGNTIYVVQRDRVSGELSVTSTVDGATSDDSTFHRIFSASISPDGQYLYTAGVYSDTLSVYRIDATTGALALIQELRQGVDGVQGLDYPDRVQVSPDGAYVFVHSFFKAAMTIYAVTPGSGRLVESKFFASVPSAFDIAFSPDGDFAYSTSQSTTSDKIRVFHLDAGQWTQLPGTSVGLNNPRDLEISADGRFVYVADATADAVIAFSRDTQSGALTLLQTLNDVTPHDSLNGVEFIKLSPDGRELFAAASQDHSLTRLTRLSGAVTERPHAITTTHRETGGVDFGIRNLFPSVTDFVSAVAGPISDPTLTFTATFDEAVSGVGPEDFQIESTGIHDASIVEVTGGPTQYNVVIDTGSGDGTLQLRLVDDDSIVNAASYPLGGVGAGNGGLLSDPVTIQKTGNIAGRLVHDVDEDGYADLGEVGLAGATVFVDVNANGVLDPDEPFAVSLADDPATTGVDEAGTYRVQGVAPGDAVIVVIPPPGFELSNPANRAAPVGNTYFVRSIKDGTSGANYLDEAAGVTTSPDGNYLYVASFNDDSVTVFSRDAVTGQLTVVQQVVDNVGGVSGLWGAQSIAITQDGENLYVASALDNALVMFDRDPLTGQLTFLGKLTDGIGGVDGLNEAVGVQVSDDGIHLYVAAVGDDSVTAFTRDPSTGLVSYTRKYVGSTNGAFAAEISPDQRHVYVSGTSSSAITVYDRDASSGLLSLKQTVRQSDAGVDGLSGVVGMSVSPDGKNVYAAGYYGDKIAVFDRDTTTGLLSFLHTTADPNGGSVAGPISVLASPDGHHVVAMYELYDAIQIFDRDPSTGQLTLSQQFRDGVGGVDGLNGAWDAEFSDDGRSLYVVGAYDDAVVIFDRNAGPWVAATVQASVSTGTTTNLPEFAAFNVAPQGVSIDYDGPLPVTADTIDVQITFSEPVVGFDADDVQLGGSLTSATVTDVVGSGSNYTATISLGIEQGTLVVTVLDDGSIDDAYGLDLGGPAIGDGTFSSPVFDVDRLAPVVASIENIVNAATSIRRLEFEVTFSEPVTQVDTSDFQVVANGLSDVAIDSVTGADDRYTVVVTNTAGTGTLTLSLVDDDTIIDVVGLPLGGTGLGNGDFAGAAQQVEPALLTGRIFHDLDDDGYGDVAEPGIGGITVYLDENTNGIRDAGEPFVVTADDDPGTTGIDESGTYSITTEQTGPATLAIDLASSQYLQTSPRQFSGGTGFLTHQQTITTDPLAVTVFGSYGVEVSPDGNFVVLQVTDDGGGIAVFRQHSEGTLESLHWYPAGSLTDFGDPQSPTFSPTGEFLFLYSKQSKRLQTYAFDLGDGSLTQVQSLDLAAAIPSNFANLDLRISPDGKNLYATSYSESTLRVFGVDPATGVVTLLQTFHDWAETPRLQNASGLTISPDGRHVYVGSFAEYYINAFDRDPIDGTLTKIQELPDVRRPSRLLSSPDGEFIIVSAWDTFTGQDLVTLRRDPETGLLSVHSRRVMPATPSGASLSPDGTSLHYADDDYADLNTLTRDPVTGAFTALDVLTDDVDVPGMRGVDDTAVSPDGRYLYAVNGFERNLHLFTRDQGNRSVIPHLTSLEFGAQDTTFNFGIFNPPPTLVSATSNRNDPTTESSATISIEFDEPVTGFDSDDLSFTAATLTEFPTATIGTVTGGPSTYSVTLTGLAGSSQVELILNDDDTVVDSLGAPLGGVGTEALSLISFSVDNVAPSVQGWLPGAGTTTTDAVIAFTVTFDEPVQGVDVDDFQLDAVDVTGASIVDVTGADDTYTINVNTGSGDGTLTVQLVDNDSITDLLAQPLGGPGVGNGDSSSNAVTIIKTGTITGTLWHDFNENGVRDQAEGGVVGVTVYLDLNDNGQFDAATEPSDVTDADDPGTVQDDEAGRYQLFNVDPGEYSVRVDSAVWSALADTDWENVTASTYTDQVTFRADNKSLRLSPDGRHLYVFDHVTNSIAVLAMPQTASDSLTEVQVLADQFDEFTNYAGDIAFTPDGAFMYVSEDSSRRVAVYARNTSDGTLVRKQLVLAQDIGPYTLEVSPDGKHLYLGGGYIAPYAINPDEGTLTGLARTDTPARVQDIAFSSDGTKLYAVDYGNVLMRVYTRDPATGGITQIQATGSQSTPNLYSNWSVEIADNDRDVYVAAPLNDLVWHFHAAADGTLSYFSKLDLDHDGVRDLPMDLQLSPDGDVLFAALGLDDAIQILYRSPDGSLTEGPIYGTKDPSITNIYQNTSSLMAVSAAGDAVVRVNNRSGSIELYRGERREAITVTVASATVTDADLGVTTPAPEVVSVTTTATSPWTGDSLQYEVTFNEDVTGVDAGDFQILSSSISGAAIDAVSGSGTTYSVTVDLSSAYGQGDLSIELIDDDTIRNDRDVPLLGYGVGSAAVSPVITIDLPAPTLDSLVFTSGTASEMQFTATFNQSVTGVDVSDFDLEFVSGDLAGVSMASVADGPTVYTVTVDLASVTGQGEFYVFLKDDDSIINGRSIPYDGVGVSPTTPRSDTVQVDFSNPSVSSITADPSPLLDYSDILFEVTFSESVFNVDAADFSILRSGVVGTSIRSVTGLPDGRTFQVLVDSGSLDGTIQLSLVDNDTIIDGLGNPLGGPGLGNGDHSSEIVPVERSPRRALSGHIFFDTDGDGVRDPGERGVDAAVVYLDLDNDGQRDANEPVGTAASDNPQTPGVDEGGFYRFGSLPLGQYILRVRPDVRWIDDINNFTSVTLEFTTTEGVADLGVTENLAAINGLVYDDLNRDGVLDAGEPGLAGWTLYIDDNQNDQLDAGERTAVTSADDPQTPEDETGRYSFSPLEFQSHRVQLVSRPEFFSTTPTYLDRTIAGGTSVEIANFGTTPNLTRISGAVFNDSDGDGIRSAGESGLADWTVFLDENQNGQWDSGEPTMQTLADDPGTTSIDEAGMFEFTTIGLGTHVVYASQPTSYLNTSPNPVSVSFTASTDTADVSFALVANDTTLSGYVFDDVDRDGVRDAGEVGVSGARVYLDLNNSESYNVGEPYQYSAADGHYELLHVVPGDYVLRATLPPLHEATSPAHNVTVALNQVITDLNFGARYLGYQISGTQFDDLNDNGVRDAGEPPLSGVVVFADLNDNGFPDSGEPQTTSGSDGDYVLTGTQPGTFTIRAISPEYYRPSASYPSRERLFGISDRHFQLGNHNKLTLFEFDPVSGDVLGEFVVDNPDTTETTLTFDGQNLVLINSDAHELNQLAFDGTEILEFKLPREATGAPYPVFGVSNPVMIGGFLFIVAGSRTDNMELWRTDLYPDGLGANYISAGDWKFLGPITLTNPPATQGVTLSLMRASTTSADGRNILVGVNASAPFLNHWLQIDPYSQTAVLVNDFNTADYERGMARIGDEVFVAYPVPFTNTDGQIIVYNNSGGINRTLNGFPAQQGLAGGLYRDNGIVVTLAERESVADVNHFHHAELGSISGNVARDLDVSGTIDAGEPALADVTVYIDLNRNWQFDPGEPSAVSDPNGDYTIGGLIPDRYTVRQVAPADHDGFAVADPITRLFTQGTDDGVSTIYEIDTDSGAVVNQFPSPGAVEAHAGMTMYEGDLYLAKSNQLFRIDPDSGEVLETIPTTPGLKDAIEIREGIAYMTQYNGEGIEQFDLRRRRLITQLDIHAINNITGLGYVIRTQGAAVDRESFILEMRSGTYNVDFRTGLIIPHTPAHSFPWNAYLAAAGGESFTFATQGFVLRTIATTSTEPYNAPGAVTYRNLYSGVAGTVSDYGAEVDLAAEHTVWVTHGDSVTGIDFGNQPEVGTVSGVQFSDDNGNGIRDVGESPLAGVTVFIDENANGFADPGERQTVSAADGTYLFADVPVGQHLIRAESPDLHRPTNFSGVRDRLFGVSAVSNTESPTGNYLQIREIDPVTGDRISTIDTTIAMTVAQTAAFDGRRLIVVDNNLDLLFEVGLDGTLIDQTPLPGQDGATVFSQGPVVIDGTIYLMTVGGSMPMQLIRYDADANTFYGAMPISRYIDSANELNGLPQLSLSLSESPDGQSILAFSIIDSRVFVIDPQTARMTTVIDLPRTDGGDWSVGAVGGELFVRSSSIQGAVDVYDSQYNLVRTLANPGTSGMGGGGYVDIGIVATVTATDATTGIDLGHQSDATTISGTVRDDFNQNRAADDGEPAVGGVRVYLDSNRNGRFDSGEPETLTDADGTYSFVDLAPGDYTVRVDQPASLKALTDTDGVELFSLEVDQGVSTIRKYDPITGQVLREFPAPGTSTTFAGLALDDSGLFYSANSTLWKLDPDDGTILDSVQLPAGEYGGLAAIDATVYAIDASSNVLYKIDVDTLQTIETIDVNAVNPPGPSGVDFQDNLGETPDVTRLMTRLHSGGGTIVLDPATGIYEPRIPTNSGTTGISGAGGEIYRVINGRIRVESMLEGLIRDVDPLQTPYGIGAASVPLSEHVVRAAPGVDHVDLDFYQQVTGPASVEGVLWDDANEDGVIDAGEDLLAGRTVFLDDNHNGVLDSGEPFTVTLTDDPATTGIDETGRYRFDDVTPGTHDVVQVLPPGWRQTYPSTGAFDIHRVADNGYVAGQNNGANRFYDSAASDDGAFIAFSTFNALLPEDTNAETDIYVLETATGQLELISVTSDEVVGDDRSVHPAISADGRYVFFLSAGTNFVANDNNNARDVFVRDRQMGTTSLVSAVDPTLSTGGASGNGESFAYRFGISSDGRYVTFQSRATDLVPGDTNGRADLFLRDLQLGTTERLNLAPDGGQASGGDTYDGHLSADGRFVAFWSWADNLVPDDTNGVSDAFLLDRQTGITERVSTSSAGGQSDDNAFDVSISDDGRYIVFHSRAKTLDDVTGSVGPQVFLKDRTTGDLKVLGRNSSGVSPDQATVTPLISGDGRWVVFNSWANNLVDNDSDSNSDAYLYEIETDTVTLLSQSVSGGSGDGTSDWVRISNDGSTVTFNSAATDLTTIPQGGGLYSVDLNQLAAETSWHSVSVGVGQVVQGVNFGSIYDPIAPSDIVLSSSSIVENLDTSASDTLIAELSTVDSDTPTGHSYELVSGADDGDNARFRIVGNQLLLKQGEVVDHESQDEYRIRLKVTDTTGQAFEKAVALDVVDVLEMAPIALGDGASPEHSSLTSLSIAFDGQVDVDPGAFSIRHRGSDGMVDVVVSLEHSGGKTTATLTFTGAYAETGGSLIDGNYQLTIDGTKIRSAGGGTNFDADGNGTPGGLYHFGEEAADGFFRLFGDSDGDRDVDGQDYGRFGLSFLKSEGQPGFDDAFDSDGDGDVDGQDYGRFGQRFLQSLPFE